MHHKVWDEITYPFPNFNGAEVWEWIRNFMLGLKLIHVSKRYHKLKSDIVVSRVASNLYSKTYLVHIHSQTLKN